MRNRRRGRQAGAGFLSARGYPRSLLPHYFEQFSKVELGKRYSDVLEYSSGRRYGLGCTLTGAPALPLPLSIC